MNYYNEFNNKAADWLESLIERKLIPGGIVDRRSIEDVLPDELTKYTQCHFFAGIGGWSRALEIAGWPEDKPVWTGSCPCQPFSAAGKGAGIADERHLWPAFYWLICQCRPEFVVGEQVAGKAGESWFDIVSNDLAHQDYTSGFSVLAACSVGAPHIRKRLYWMANACSKLGRLSTQREWREASKVVGSCETSRLANANDERSQRRSERGNGADESTTWESSLVECSDGKIRPFKPGVLPLAHGVSGRVELIKGYGNAIVPQCGAAFITAAMESLSEGGVISPD